MGFIAVENHRRYVFRLLSMRFVEASYCFTARRGREQIHAPATPSTRSQYPQTRFPSAFVLIFSLEFLQVRRVKAAHINGNLNAARTKK
ncbi:hypothetical protein [Nitrobacter sp. TKz-YC01]|uniref:hypothetical protein n=1 Tax=Nitrobacter sp. TKz-YC01 TaxID=3398703 RepID=UPI003A1028CD